MEEREKNFRSLSRGPPAATSFCPRHVYITEYHALLDGEVTAEEKAQVMGGNLLRLLGVPR